jgi:hypothetical protein
MDNGVLAVTIEGRVLASGGEITRHTAGRLKTHTRLQEEQAQIPVPEEFSELIHLTHQLMQHPDQPYDPDDDMGVNDLCAATLGYCLASLLPIDESDKQAFLGLSPLLLLEALQDQIDDLQI